MRNITVFARLVGPSGGQSGLSPLVRGRGDESVILQAVLDGEPLERLRVVPPGPCF